MSFSIWWHRRLDTLGHNIDRSYSSWTHIEYLGVRLRVACGPTDILAPRHQTGAGWALAFVKYSSEYVADEVSTPRSSPVTLDRRGSGNPLRHNRGWRMGLWGAHLAGRTLKNLGADGCRSRSARSY